MEVTVINVTSKNIIDFDETNTCDDPGHQTVTVRKRAKHSEGIIDTTKSSTSVMSLIAGDGTLLPLHIMYKSKRVYDAWTKNGPEGALIDFYDRWFHLSH